jgi:nucleotide-binding universal stress UspA family protein
LVVREEDPASQKTMKVLVACGEDEAWHAAARRLLDFSWPKETQCLLFHVIEALGTEHFQALARAPNRSVIHADELMEEYKLANERQLSTRLQKIDASRDDLPSLVQNAEVSGAEGHVVDEIIRQVREGGIRLVVVGARQLGPVRRLLGSTSEGLLLHCPCSVLVVHHCEMP